MSITACDSFDWTMEQHEAAAAALGSFAARLMKMGAPAPTSPYEPDPFAKGLTVGADQCARWMAREAWRHAGAALRENEHKTAALMARSQAWVADDLRVICCVCKLVMREGKPGGPVSHGYCARCEAATLAEFDREAGSDDLETCHACEGDGFDGRFLGSCKTCGGGGKVRRVVSRESHESHEPDPRD